MRAAIPSVLSALAVGLSASLVAAQPATETAPDAAKTAAPDAEAATPEAPPKPPLRKPRPEPTEVEVVDLTEGAVDPQRLAVGPQIGGGWMTNQGSKGAGFVDVALAVDIGLGAGGARVPWSLEPYFAFAVTYGTGLGAGVHPNRFTEIGARIVYRFPGGPLDGSWLSLGGGLVWTSTKPSSGYLGSAPCKRDQAAAEAQGLSCADDGDIAPGGLIDVGIGVREWTTRRARVGFGVRAPLQLSSNPGFGVLGFFYAQVGTGR